MNPRQPSTTATNAGAIGAIVALSGASGKRTISNCVIGGGFGKHDNQAADYGHFESHAA